MTDRRVTAPITLNSNRDIAVMMMMMDRKRREIYGMKISTDQVLYSRGCIWLLLT